ITCDVTLDDLPRSAGGIPSPGPPRNATAGHHHHGVGEEVDGGFGSDAVALHGRDCRRGMEEKTEDRGEVVESRGDLRSVGVAWSGDRATTAAVRLLKGGETFGRAGGTVGRPCHNESSPWKFATVPAATRDAPRGPAPGAPRRRYH